MEEVKKLGIWRNEECVQCGACCYELNMFVNDKPCPNQEIRNSKSYCLAYRTENRTYGDLCRGFFCSDLGDPIMVKDIEKQRKKLRQIAVRLGTAPEALEAQMRIC